MRLHRVDVPPLYAITSPLPGIGTIQLAQRLVAAGIRWIQVRQKSAGDLELLRALKEIQRALPRQCTLLVNDRVDLALASSAGGVHLGDGDLPPAEARSIAGEGMIVGTSTHSLEQALQAANDPAVDYVAIGPIFQSPTKNVRSPLGTDVIRALRQRIEKPIVAIGGIDHSNLIEVLDAGADSAALISALYRNGQVEENVHELLRMVRPR